MSPFFFVTLLRVVSSHSSVPSFHSLPLLTSMNSTYSLSFFMVILINLLWKFTYTASSFFLPFTSKYAFSTFFLFFSHESGGFPVKTQIYIPNSLLQSCPQPSSHLTPNSILEFHGSYNSAISWSNHRLLSEHMLWCQSRPTNWGSSFQSSVMGQTKQRLCYTLWEKVTSSEALWMWGHSHSITIMS